MAIPENAFQNERPTLAKPLKHLFDHTKGFEAPASFKKSLNSDFATRSRDSSRIQISALQAALRLYRLGQLALAGKTWQTCCFVPQGLVYHEPSMKAYFVLATQLYCARLWPLVGAEPSFVLDPNASCEWMSVTNYKDWRAIPWEAQLNAVDVHKHGFLGLH